MSTQDPPGSATLTIGAVSQATGIAANTLRTWERRYGFPEPVRTCAGHRLYATADVERLRLIGRALGKGLRPGQVVCLPIDELRHLVTSTRPGTTEPDAKIHVCLKAWLDATERLDGEWLDLTLRSELAHHGALTFLSGRVAPFLVALGEAWAAGRLRVFHEHFASSRLEAWLSGLWRPLADRNTGPVAIAATLPGELHRLGLEMAASALALAGWRVVYLGASTPPIDVTAAAAHAGATAVVVSASSHAPARATAQRLSELRALLPDGVELVVGGAGAPPDVPGSLWLPDLDTLYGWGRQVAS